MASTLCVDFDIENLICNNSDDLFSGESDYNRVDLGSDFHILSDIREFHFIT